MNAGGSSSDELTYHQITNIVNINGIYTDAEVPVEPEEGNDSGLTDEDIVHELPDYEGDATDEDIMDIFNGTD